MFNQTEMQITGNHPNEISRAYTEEKMASHRGRDIYCAFRSSPPPPPFFRFIYFPVKYKI